MDGKPPDDKTTPMIHPAIRPTFGFPRPLARQLLIDLHGPCGAKWSRITNDTRMIGKLFWVLLTAVFTFGFIVLFENGPDNYVTNCQTEFQDLKAYVATPAKKKADTSDQLK